MLVFLLLPLMFGENIGGYKSWIILGSLSFQFSEFAKLFIIVFLAGFLAEYAQMIQSEEFVKRLPFRFFAPLLGVGTIAIGMFVLQHDLGSALLFFGITGLSGFGPVDIYGKAVLFLPAAQEFATCFSHMFKHVSIFG